MFTRFDDIIKQHDAYKVKLAPFTSYMHSTKRIDSRVIAKVNRTQVETTGETYMVASGVPTENDGNHVFEIG